MKMNLDMTFEEGKKVIEALHECAIKFGWTEEDLDESGVMEEYTFVVDAALTAMGISINIAGKPEPEVEDDDFDDEEWDEDEEGGYFNSDDEDEDEELPSDEEVMNLIMQVLYGQ